MPRSRPEVQTEGREHPLFPGYAFCRFDVKKRLPILMTTVVISVLGFCKEPTAIAGRNASTHAYANPPYWIIVVEAGAKLRSTESNMSREHTATAL